MIYQQSPAYRSAVAHPYHVSLYAGWADHVGLTFGFQTEEEARSFAASRPEPLIDLVRRDHGVIAARRMVRPMMAPHAMREPFVGRDDFPQIEEMVR